MIIVLNKLPCNLLRVFSCKIPKYSDAQVYDNIGLLFDVAFNILCCSINMNTLHRCSNIFISGGGGTHTRERSDRVGEGVGGVPLTRCEKCFIFKNPEVTSDTY